MNEWNTYFTDVVYGSAFLILFFVCLNIIAIKYKEKKIILYLNYLWVEPVINIYIETRCE